VLPTLDVSASSLGISREMLGGLGGAAKRHAADRGSDNAGCSVGQQGRDAQIGESLARAAPPHDGVEDGPGVSATKTAGPQDPRPLVGSWHGRR
jgi:hypothetical protein